MEIPIPQAPCAACCANPETALSLDNKLNIIFCDHHQVGSVMAILDGQPAGRWTTFSPTSREEFSSYLCRLVDDSEMKNKCLRLGRNIPLN